LRLSNAGKPRSGKLAAGELVVGDVSAGSEVTLKLALPRRKTRELAPDYRKPHEAE
jgi:hypothetical protein